MKSVLGILFILGGIFAGLYVGLWWAFIGGIVQLIDAIKATDTSAIEIAMGIARIVCASFLGGLTAVIGITSGIVLLKS